VQPTSQQAPVVSSLMSQVQHSETTSALVHAQPQTSDYAKDITPSEPATRVESPTSTPSVFSSFETHSMISQVTPGTIIPIGSAETKDSSPSGTQIIPGQSRPPRISDELVTASTVVVTSSSQQSSIDPNGINISSVLISQLQRQILQQSR
jgi:hypothetical protein